MKCLLDLVMKRVGNSNGVVVAATGAGETRVCLGIIPIKVQVKVGLGVIETYALLDNGSEVTSHCAMNG